MEDLNNQISDREDDYADHQQQQHAREMVFQMMRNYHQERHHLQATMADVKASILRFQRQQTSSPQLQDSIHELQQFLQRLEQQEAQVLMKQDHLNQLIWQHQSKKRRADV